MTDWQAKQEALKVVRHWDGLSLREQMRQAMEPVWRIATRDDLARYVAEVWPGMTVEQWRNSPGTW